MAEDAMTPQSETDDYECGRAFAAALIGAPLSEQLDPLIVERYGRVMRAPMVEMAEAMTDAARALDELLARSGVSITGLLFPKAGAR